MCSTPVATLTHPVFIDQTLLEDADERESALRIEVAEMKSQVLSYRREVESLKAQQKATSTSLYESSGRVQADLMAQLRDAERSVRA